MPSLSYVDDRGEERLVMLQGEPVVIGRSVECEISVDSPTVSRRHCTVSATEDGGFEVYDLGSTHGTDVGGSRLAGRHRLEDGDRIVCGAAFALEYFDVP